MIELVHNNSKTLKKVFRDGKEISGLSQDIIENFWSLAKMYPEDWIFWIDQRYYDQFNRNEIDSIFHHDLIMASFPVATQFFSDAIGYIDQLPFVNPSYEVKYPGWRMSTDMGGIKGQSALKFYKDFHEISNFGYLLNCMAKVGQQNGLFCYTNPNLIKNGHNNIKLTYKASDIELFQFVYQHYKTIWVFILFFCFLKYESKFPFFALLKSFFHIKYFKKEIDLSGITIDSAKSFKEDKSVDVIIPTMGRAQYLKQVLTDLAQQTHLPQKVIVVEQNPMPDSETQLEYIEAEEWPFEIVHYFTHKTGACMARNMALDRVTSKWVFLADDDIRISKNVIENALSEIFRIGSLALNINCVQKKEETTFTKMKQWGAFGSGTTILNSKLAQSCKFDEALEYGYGEDTDFGLQLRARGVDVIYHPEIKITHLKADRGGFRSVIKLPWEDEPELPKPSPTMMFLIKKHYSEEMIKGYKVALFLKFYRRQSINNPFTYIRTMRRRWQLSEHWAEKLETLALNQDD